MRQITKDMCRPFTPEDFTKPLQPEIEEGMDKILMNRLKIVLGNLCAGCGISVHSKPTAKSILKHRRRVNIPNR